jgi:hypothetical protein
MQDGDLRSMDQVDMTGYFTKRTLSFNHEKSCRKDEHALG